MVALCNTTNKILVKRFAVIGKQLANEKFVEWRKGKFSKGHVKHLAFKFKY